jgi:phage pi2 protein 07
MGVIATYSAVNSIVHITKATISRIIREFKVIVGEDEKQETIKFNSSLFSMGEEVVKKTKTKALKNIIHFILSFPNNIIVAIITSIIVDTPGDVINRVKELSNNNIILTTSLVEQLHDICNSVIEKLQINN